MNSYIVKQVNTEKTYKLQEKNVYVFLFPRTARKDDIKKVVESQFSVKVDSVQTVMLKRKKKSFKGVRGVSSQYKKAYIKVADGMKINIEGNVNKN